MQRCIAILLLLLATHAALAQTDSLRDAYAAATTATQRGNIAYEIGKRDYAANPQRSLAYCRQGFAEVQGLEMPARVNLANLLGIYHSLRGSYDSAAYFYSIAMSTARRLDDAALINKVAANTGDLYSYKGEYARALKMQLQVLEYSEQHGAAADVQRVTVNVGNTYFYMRNYVRALAYYNKVYPALKGSKSRLAGNLLNSMAVAYGETGNKKAEESLLTQSLAIKRALDDSLGITNTLINLADAAADRGDQKASAVLLQEAMDMAQRIHNDKAIQIIRQNLGKLEEASGHTEAAIRRYKAALAAAQSSGDLRLQRGALAKLYALYDSLHDYTAGRQYRDAYDELVDTTRSLDYLREVATAETKYETQKALRDRDRLTYESRLQGDARRRALLDRNLALGIGIGGIVALSLIFLLAWRIRSNRIKNEEAQGYTRAIFEGEQNERIRIARDLHDSIGQMLAVVKMRLSALPGLTTEELAESADISMQLVDKTISEVRVISHNLIPEALAFGIVRGLESLCARINAAGEVRVELVVDEDLRDRKFNQQFSLSLYRIAQEVLGNMMKHAGASLIDISMDADVDLILLQIKDNGKGFDTSAIGASKGIGWKNVFARVDLLNGSVDVRSERISGTRIEIRIPQ